jgi:hypothetical protein
MFPAGVSLGCGASPTSPAHDPALTDGTFLLSLIGDSSSCNDIKVPPAGTSVKVNLAATHDGSGTWIAHGATTADGTIEMRLSQTTTVAMASSGPAEPSDYYVNGWISGTANDSTAVIFPPGPTNRTVTFDGQMSVSGIIRPLAKFGDGYSNGAMTFSKDGASAACPAGAVGWFINWQF